MRIASKIKVKGGVRGGGREECSGVTFLLADQFFVFLTVGVGKREEENIRKEGKEERGLKVRKGNRERVGKERTVIFRKGCKRGKMSF